MPRLVHHEDEDAAASELVAELLQQEGIKLRLNAECLSLSSDPNGTSVHVGCKEGDTEVRGSHVLLAMGRAPNTNDLGLEVAGGRLFPMSDPLATYLHDHLGGANAAIGLLEAMRELLQIERPIPQS